MPETLPHSIPSKKSLSVEKVVKSCVRIFLIVLGLIVLIGIFFPPIAGGGIKQAKENASMQSARQISIAMNSYTTDHHGAYPDGATSTEVFQKLIDGKYVSDPSIFCIFSMPGKTRATSNKLTPENVSYDVTSGADSTSPGNLPLVFSTGYVVTYGDRLEVTPSTIVKSPFPGIAVAYKDSSARFYIAKPDGSIPPIVPETFSLGPKNYRQLKP